MTESQETKSGFSPNFFQERVIPDLAGILLAETVTCEVCLPEAKRVLTDILPTRVNEHVDEIVDMVLTKVPCEHIV